MQLKFIEFDTNLVCIFYFIAFHVTAEQWSIRDRPFFFYMHTPPEYYYIWILPIAHVYGMRTNKFHNRTSYLYISTINFSSSLKINTKRINDLMQFTAASYPCISVCLCMWCTQLKIWWLYSITFFNFHPISKNRSWIEYSFSCSKTL